MLKALTEILGEQLPRELNVHLVGASDADEARSDWQLFWELLAEHGVERATIWLVGPHMLSAAEPCNSCKTGKYDEVRALNTRTVRVHCVIVVSAMVAATCRMRQRAVP